LADKPKKKGENMRLISEITIHDKQLSDIIESHRLYLFGDASGIRADLRYADLCDAYLSGDDLRGAYLDDADLSGADLSDANLSDAYLSGADLTNADLTNANLRSANLSDADLRNANLRGADLRGADLRCANLDFSCIPLSCKGLNFTIDERLAKQLVYHIINLMIKSKISTRKIFKKNVFKWLKNSHLVTRHDLPVLEDEI
jgi:hypothetical protein